MQTLQAARKTRRLHPAFKAAVEAEAAAGAAGGTGRSVVASLRRFRWNCGRGMVTGANSFATGALR
eukprot:996913-Alexandrium_andersonii.AAC.1